jgi:hypothetical protein
MSRKFIIVAALRVSAGIAFVTPSSTELIIRPRIADPNLERFLPDRDDEFLEMLKAAGGLASTGVAIILSRLFPRKD